MPGKPLDAETPEVSPRPDDITLPDALLEQITGYLTMSTGASPLWPGPWLNEQLGSSYMAGL